jgi:hypothetical protein
VPSEEEDEEGEEEGEEEKCLFISGYLNAATGLQLAT